ncbi:MAG TPA: hypothetical protein VFZ61_20355, partial [Polyangiales bacterium]
MRPDWELAYRLDQLLVSVAEKVRPLPSLASDDAGRERVRLTRELVRGEQPRLSPHVRRMATDASVLRTLDQARRVAEQSVLGPLYRQRLDELELDLAILDAWGETKRVLPLSARRYGTGHEVVALPASGAGDEQAEPRSAVSVGVLAQRLLTQLSPCDMGPHVVPAAGAAGELSVAALVLRAAAGIGLDPSVRVEPRLSSLAATGERTVFLSARMYSLHEAR